MHFSAIGREKSPIRPSSEDRWQWAPREVLGILGAEVGQEDGVVEIESEWTARDRELKIFGGPARTFLCPGPAKEKNKCAGISRGI
jgi:hypothetical protein